MPPDIKQALPRIHQVLRAMGVAEVSAAGVEADDVIGTLSTRALQEGFFVAIVSPDKARGTFLSLAGNSFSRARTLIGALRPVLTLLLS